MFRSMIYFKLEFGTDERALKAHFTLLYRFPIILVLFVKK